MLPVSRRDESSPSRERRLNQGGLPNDVSRLMHGRGPCCLTRRRKSIRERTRLPGSVNLSIDARIEGAHQVWAIQSGLHARLAFKVLRAT